MPHRRCSGRCGLRGGRRRGALGAGNCRFSGSLGRGRYWFYRGGSVCRRGGCQVSAGNRGFHGSLGVGSSRFCRGGRVRGGGGGHLNLRGLNFGFGLGRSRGRNWSRLGLGHLGGFEPSVGELDHVSLMDQPMQISDHGRLLGCGLRTAGATGAGAGAAGGRAVTIRRAPPIPRAAASAGQPRRAASEPGPRSACVACSPSGCR